MNKYTNVVAGIIKKHDKYLMVYHKKIDKWTIPVGAVSALEDNNAALSNEIHEAYGIRLLHVGKYKDFKVMEGMPIDGNTIYITQVEDYVGTPTNKLKDKHLEMKWYTLDEIRELDLSVVTLLALGRGMMS